MIEIIGKDGIFHKLGKLRGYLEINKFKNERNNDDTEFEDYFLNLVDELEEHFLNEWKE